MATQSAGRREAADGRMRAVRIAGPGKTETLDVPRPRPGPGEVRIRVTGCGVCGSNLGPWEGLPWLTYPLAPGEGGHEAWGVVDALGEGVEGPAPGTPVTGLTYRSFAEYDLARAEHLVVLPPDLADAPFPGEPVGCGVNVFRRSGIEPGETVAVVGVGFIGAVAAHLAARVGARVIGLSRRPFSLELARRMGAAETVPMEDHGEAVARVLELTGGAGCDRVIEAAGAQWPLDLAGEIVRERGTLVIAGYHQDGPRQVSMQQWNWKGLDVVNAHERAPEAYLKGIRGAVNAARHGGLDVASLVTHRFPLDRLDEALEAARTRPEGLVKAVVTP